MRILPTDHISLDRALELAAGAAAFASPNPAVGCTLVREGMLLGEGAHRYELRDHAEIAALKQAAAAGHTVRGATAYVTLEPCSHQGRTGPCADALIAAGVRRCVVATVDPNPLVRGQGLARLRAAGVEVTLLESRSPEGQRARRLNDAFAFSVQHGRPFVTLKAALSLDGKLAPPPETRTPAEPVWLTGPSARAEVQALRHAADVLLTGIGTVLADDPLLTDRTGLPRRRPLLRVVLDSALRTPLASALVCSVENDLVVFCDETAEPARADALLRAGVTVTRVPQLHSASGLRTVLGTLQDLQCRSVMVEGGSGLNTALLQAELVDQVVLYFADRELGAGAVPFTTTGLSPYRLQQQLAAPSRQSLPHGETEDVRITGYLHDPWMGI